MPAHIARASIPWWFALPAVAGLVLHVYEALFASSGDHTGFRMGLLIWSVLPFAVALVLWRFGLAAVCASGYAWASLVGSISMHYAVFVRPAGSTAALGLLFMPLWNLVLLGPIGVVLAWVLKRAVSGRGRNAV